MKPRILAVITARGGSKGVLRKNTKLLAGKPLIAWTIEEAKKSQYITKLILSSEDQEIIEVAKQYGCDVPFIRPVELAEDQTLGVDVVLHAIENCPGYEYVVLLQPTSPLRKVQDIDGCIENLLKNNADYCVTVKEASESPYWMYTLDEQKKLKQLIPQKEIPLRRQELSPIFILNGAVYAAKIKSFIESKGFLTQNTLAYIMPEERSYDIDTEVDFSICERLISKKTVL